MIFKIYSLAEIRSIPIGTLREFAKEIGVKGPTTLPKEALENAVYARLKEIEAQRKVPLRLVPVKSHAGLPDKSRVADSDRELFGPYSTERKGIQFERVKGYFRPYDNGDGMLSTSLVPKESDIFVSQSFIDRAQLKHGDIIEGGYVYSEQSELNILGEIYTVNGRSIAEHRAADMEQTERLFPDEPLEFWDERADIKTLALAAPIKKGCRMLMAHTSDVATDDFSVALYECFKKNGFYAIALFLGVAPEKEAAIKNMGASACPFDVEDKYVSACVELAIETAYRSAEEGNDVCLIVDSLEFLADNNIARKLLACACKTAIGSISVFAVVNSEIMSATQMGLLRASAHAYVPMTALKEGLTVEFSQVTLKAPLTGYSILDGLKNMNSAAANAVVASCADKAAVQKLLK